MASDSNVTLYNVELFRGDGGTFYMLWIQEVAKTRYARYRLHVPKLHGEVLRVMDDGMWMEYAKKHRDQAVRLETDASKEYPGPRGPRSGEPSEEDSGTEDDAHQRSNRQQATRQSMGKVRTAGTRHTKSNL